MDDLMDYIQAEINKSNKIFAFGGYTEDRDFYQNATLFGSEEPRRIHLGLDIWCDAGTPICMPINGRIHSFRNNKSNGDYGPTIITKHELDQTSFFLLFGHLSQGSLGNQEPGSWIDKGGKLAELGNFEENGNWPPHLHFQIIEDIGNYMGDYPGVSANSDLEYYLNNCPDPMIIYNE